MMGVANMSYDTAAKAIIAETGVNRIVINNASAQKFVIGQTVSLGASIDTDAVAKNRVITNMSAYNAGNTAITFDGSPVNIAINNTIASRPWKNGATNIIKASSDHSQQFRRTVSVHMAR